MTKELLEKANELKNDIAKINNVLIDHKKHKWITVGSPFENIPCYSKRFRDELAEWLEAKKEEYEKEFEGL
jgi:hypothetical protein